MQPFDVKEKPDVWIFDNYHEAMEDVAGLFADFKNGIHAWFRESDLSQPVVPWWSGYSAAFPF